MRRLVLLVALATVASLGFGAAFVVAGSNRSADGTPGTGAITICHTDEGTFKENWEEISPDASSIIGPSGHGMHPNDIIPPFYYIENGTQYFYPGLNMNTVYTGGYTGAEVLANGCDLPTSSRGITSTVTTTITRPTTITETLPGTTVTVPPETITTPVTVTVTIPAVTVTMPGSTTVVTVPAGQTTTVTLPTQTVTLPTSTQTLPGETIEHDPVTVTMPGTTQTITAGATPTVVTVTAPHKTVEGGVLGAKAVVVTVTGPTHTIHLPPHIIKEVVKAKTIMKRILETVIRACEGIGPGKG